MGRFDLQLLWFKPWAIAILHYHFCRLFSSWAINVIAWGALCCAVQSRLCMAMEMEFLLSKEPKGSNEHEIQISCEEPKRTQRNSWTNNFFLLKTTRFFEPHAHDRSWQEMYEHLNHFVEKKYQENKNLSTLTFFFNSWVADGPCLPYRKKHTLNNKQHTRLKIQQNKPTTNQKHPKKQLQKRPSPKNHQFKTRRICTDLEI